MQAFTLHRFALSMHFDFLFLRLDYPSLNALVHI